jgi:hypothetical protein
MKTFLIGSEFNSPKTLTVFETIDQANTLSNDCIPVEANTPEEAFLKYKAIECEMLALSELFPSESENSSADKLVVYREGETSITYSTKKPEGTFYSDWAIRNGKLIAIFEHQDRVTKRKLADTAHRSVLDVKEIGYYYSVTISK